jgi:hypothetical protein
LVGTGVDGNQIVSLTCGEGTAFAAGVKLHPSALDAADASKITVPICMLPSQDEDVAVVKAFEEALTVPKYVEIFEEAPHVSFLRRIDLLWSFSCSLVV